MNRLRFTIRGLVYLLFTIGLGGATCGGSTAASTPQTPPAPASNLRFFIDDIDTYPAIPSCGIDSRYDVDRVTDSWRGTMLMNGWADRHAAWPIPSPSDWIEYHLLPWGNDYNAVDAAHLAVYAGHGGVPESTTFQNWDIEPPHQTLFFNREQVFPSYGESTCFAPISGARTNGGALGSGEGLTTSHAYFLSSCTMAFRLVDPYFVANNRVRQAFGFRFSPVLGPIAARAFKDMFDDTLSMPNWFAWWTRIRTALQVDGTPAGSVSYSFSDVSYDEAQRTMERDALKLGANVGVILPQATARTFTYFASVDPCLDSRPCREPASTCPGQYFGVIDLGQDQSPLTGKPTRNFPAAQALTVGTRLPLFVVRKRARRTSTEISTGAKQLTEALTDLAYTVPPFDDHADQAVAGGITSFGDVGSNAGFSYDKNRDILTVATSRSFLRDEVMGGNPAVVSLKTMNTEVARWLDLLPAAQLPNQNFWSIDRPMVSEIFDGFIGPEPQPRAPRLQEYTYTIFRSINGLPWRDSWLSIWVNRHGKADLVVLNGRGAGTGGDPGAEFPDPWIGEVEVKLTQGQLLERFHASINVRFGETAVAHVIWDGFVYVTISNQIVPVYMVSYGLELNGIALRGAVDAFSVSSGKITKYDKDPEIPVD